MKENSSRTVCPFRSQDSSPSSHPTLPGRNPTPYPAPTPPTPQGPLGPTSIFRPNTRFRKKKKKKRFLSFVSKYPLSPLSTIHRPGRSDPTHVTPVRPVNFTGQDLVSRAVGSALPTGGLRPRRSDTSLPVLLRPPTTSLRLRSSLVSRLP